MEGQCNYFVTRKKRFCRMTVRAGAKFCGEHEPKTKDEKEEINPQGSSRLRMACPLDPKHTCYVSKLDKHLKVCNAKQDVLPGYIVKNCNLTDNFTDGNTTDGGDNTNRRSLANVPEEKILQVIKIVQDLYEKVVKGNISTHLQSEPHACVVGELSTQGRGDGTKKHLVQTSALITIMEQQLLLQPGTCFVELGAGKGQVSYYLGNVASKTPGCSVLLVDRASHRHKQDNRLDREHLQVERLRADIADLVLDKVPTVCGAKHLVGMSKHLCGVATDLALRCLTKPDVVNKTEGVVMATCCHHRCLWNSYVGKPFLESHNISEDQFDVICGLVSWATCGTGLSRERRAQLAEENNTSSKDAKKPKYDESLEDISEDLKGEYGNIVEDSEESNNILHNESEKKCFDEVKIARNLGLSLLERAEVGFKAKSVFDWGRREYLMKQGFTCKLCFYVSKDVSPENVCIVATKVK